MAVTLAGRADGDIQGLRLVDGDDAAVASAHRRLLLLRRSWFLDTRAGVPNYDLSQLTRDSLVDLIRAEALSAEGVARVTGIDVRELEGRRLELMIHVSSTVDGPGAAVPALELEI